jgi:hypothetical protein
MGAASRPPLGLVGASGPRLREDSDVKRLTGAFTALVTVCGGHRKKRGDEEDVRVSDVMFIHW